ncbi:hypothetical protein PGH45_04855 [Legionella pneumophila]|nr:hypothetical protein [Legionella pneumophila]
MGRIFLVSLFILLNYNLFASSGSNFILCKSTYALCTTALCKAIPEKKGMASCKCDVKFNQYSVGTKPCTGVTKTKNGFVLSSRYSPISSYVSCQNSRPWAFCLDSPCLVDSQNPKIAFCLCTLVKNKGNYVIVTNHYNKNTCITGIYSSATIKDVQQVTQFLKRHSELPPYPIKILNAR